LRDLTVTIGEKQVVKQQQPMDFEYVITGDESWFYSYNPPDAAWAVSRDEPPERIKRKIDIGKDLISVLWSVNGIHYLLDVPPAMKYNSSFFCFVVLSGLTQNSPSNDPRKDAYIILYPS
jgi:hypothetical protein